MAQIGRLSCKLLTPPYIRPKKMAGTKWSCLASNQKRPTVQRQLKATANIM